MSKRETYDAPRGSYKHESSYRDIFDQSVYDETFYDKADYDKTGYYDEADYGENDEYQGLPYPGLSYSAVSEGADAKDIFHHVCRELPPRQLARHEPLTQAQQLSKLGAPTAKCSPKQTAKKHKNQS